MDYSTIPHVPYDKILYDKIHKIRYITELVFGLKVPFVDENLYTQSPLLNMFDMMHFDRALF